ncbi:RnfH family protein [Rhodoferax sp. AJA081-3]|uniref:RnfH family protein n=1 Tax=Rhodoferax sp. AJA081-3 TaxID=2752316 RepID=UPI001AE01075|nr:RnfH family protein [Rhodoferax sp. AJA081-3]QTN28718.1 RnfH family protein [Rhodoferax sp. AJA081-3]
MGTEVGIAVTVVYSAQTRDVVEETLRLEEGTTVEQALNASGLALPTPAEGVPLGGQGVWGKKVGLTHVLHDQDRLEVYRPLTVDPKVARRERFAGQGAKKAAGLFAKRRDGAKAGY